MTRRIDTLLLLALPASGKSELRRYLASLDYEVASRDLGLGPPVDLDDYPYVHLMRRIDAVLAASGAERLFYESDDHPFRDGRDWATLIRLLSGDYEALGTQPDLPAAPSWWLLSRIEASRRESGIPEPLPKWDEKVCDELSKQLDEEIAAFARRRAETLASHQSGVSTVLVEFARGGPGGADPPLSPPYGYEFSLSVLDPALLRRAAVLYVWVTPEESRRRNRERAIPGLEGDASILHHGVPELVMQEDYGSDDFLWLLERGGGSAIHVETADGTVAVPAAVFDNRVDVTSFLRADRGEWDRSDVTELHRRLMEAFAALT